MGQKVNPIGFRLGGLQEWKSKWYASKKSYADILMQDIKMRRFLTKSLREALVSRNEIERSRSKVTVTIFAAKPGIIIGRAGAGIEDLKKKISRQFLKPKTNLHINIQEVRQPNLNATIVAQTIVNDIEKRMPFRRVMKQTMARVQKEGAKGVKIMIKGRLNGAEIARSEKVAEGLIPLHTLRADIDYARTHAQTAYGKIGVKVWIYRGEVFDKVNNKIKPVKRALKK